MSGYSVEPCDLLLALEIAQRYKLNIAEAKLEALCLMDWAVQNSDVCPPQKLLQDSAKVHIKRGDR